MTIEIRATLSTVAILELTAIWWINSTTESHSLSTHIRLGNHVKENAKYIDTSSNGVETRKGERDGELSAGALRKIY